MKLVSRIQSSLAYPAILNSVLFARFSGIKARHARNTIIRSRVNKLEIKLCKKPPVRKLLASCQRNVREEVVVITFRRLLDAVSIPHRANPLFIFEICYDSTFILEMHYQAGGHSEKLVVGELSWKHNI